MGPGPSDVPPSVLEAMAKQTIGHLDPAFIEVMDAIKNLLRYAFQTDNRLTMPVSGPGTAGMETCISNLVEPGDTVVIVENGVFGQRMKAMAERCRANVVYVEEPWGRAIRPEVLDETLGTHPEASIVAFVHAETSTGALSDAETLVDIAHQHDALAIVDAVTSLGGVPVMVDEWDIDALYTGSQKCLSCTPGLSPISLNGRAVEHIRTRSTPVQSWFLDLSLVMDYWGGEGGRSYHHTAPINALYGLHESLRRLHEEGLEAAWTRHRHHHEALKAGLAELGLEYIVPEGERIPQLNAVTVPEGIDEVAVRHTLLHDHQLEIGAGLGDMAGAIWRIGLMGYSCRAANVRRCLQAIGETLQAHGLDVEPDAAVAAADEQLSARQAASA